MFHYFVAQDDFNGSTHYLTWNPQFHWHWTADKEKAIHSYQKRQAFHLAIAAKVTGWHVEEWLIRSS